MKVAMPTLRFDVIECANGWQVEAHLGKFTIYSDPLPTSDKAREMASKMAKRLGRAAVFSETTVSNPGNAVAPAQK